MKSFNSLIEFLTEEDVADVPTSITLAKTIENAAPALKADEYGDVTLDLDDEVYTLRKFEKNMVQVELLDKKNKKIIDTFLVKQRPYVDRIIKVIDKTINKRLAVH
jgi:hypothetical protein